MLKPIKTNDEAVQFFEDLKTKPASAIHFGNIYMAAYQWQQFDNEAAQARKLFDDKYYSILDTYKVSDKIWIVKLQKKNFDNEIMYAPVVNGENVRDWFDTIERAIVGAISYQMTMNSDAGRWAMKLIESVSTEK